MGEEGTLLPARKPLSCMVVAGPLVAIAIMVAIVVTVILT